MTNFRQKNLFQILVHNVPLILLIVSVLNEFDFNYLETAYFSFNFPFILIFYCSLQKNESLGYGFIFIAGLINDVVVGFPIGISSMCYLLICVFAAYLKNITIRPNSTKDWLFFLFTILFINSLLYSSLNLFFSFKLDYYILITNLVFTFLLYFVFSYLFNLFFKIVSGTAND